MLTRSTSGLRSLLPFAFQLPCTLCRNPTLFMRSRLTAPVLLSRSCTFTLHHSYGVLQERNRPRNHESPATNSCQRSTVHSLSSRLAAVRTMDPPFFTGTPALPADENVSSPVVGTSLLSHPLDRHGRMSRVQQPHRVRNHAKRKCPAQRRRTLLWVMLSTKSPDRAWKAYQELLSYRVVIPHHMLHQLVRLLASIKPRTRALYLQLLSVLKTLQRNGGRLRLWEWNTLIDSSGKQWHKTRLEDYENSLDIFNKKGILPAGNAASGDESLNPATDSYSTRQDPDIWTYNILLSIASRSALPLTVRHASSLLRASGLPPDRYSHLCLLRYFAVRRDLRSVRSTLRKMKQQDLEVGMDGINACLWAYAQSGRFDVALRIYRVLRSNINPAPSLGEHDIDDDSHYIRDTVGLDILDGFEPDRITYTMMIQALAYHGDLSNALSVFIDMLSTPDREACARTDGPTAKPKHYKPTMAAFRGLFLGFARHGRDLGDCTVMVEPTAMLSPYSQVTWNLDTLETIFAAFLRLPSLPKPTDRLVYWILVGFDKTSGNDPARLRDVWIKLEAKYGDDSWGGRLKEIKGSIFP